MAKTTEIIEPIGQVNQISNIIDVLSFIDNELAMEVGMGLRYEAVRDNRWNIEIFALSSQMYARVALVEEV
jgi:hypothetical protein